MSLYNKYLPKWIGEVVGQNIPKQILLQIYNRQNFPNALLFSGIAGIGKTLLARIFSKMMNCSNICVTTKLVGDEQYVPCYKCEACLSDSDIIEIDGATYTGVANIREILDNINYLPFHKYQIYIIDEVHMLSQNAFDALLLTLQNPPEHAKFIFATTNFHKLPVTFLSRCLHLPLIPINENDFINYISMISKTEREIYNKKPIELDSTIFKILYEESEGSIRTGLNFIELLSYLDDVNIDMVYDYLKIVSPSKVLQLLEMVLNGKTSEAIKEWIELKSMGYDDKRFLHRLSKIINELTMAILNKEVNTSSFLLQKYNISLKLLVAFWEIVINQMEAIYNGCINVTETTLLLLSLVDDENFSINYMG